MPRHSLDKAPDQNRTDTRSLEGYCSTIELQAHRTHGSSRMETVSRGILFFARSNQMNHKHLKKWFLETQRDLPWRESRTPYAVWVSEMMLQQTQVAVVIPYFERWMRLFPTIEDLARAPLDAVIKAWEGLGYYSRARYLHAGAQYVVENHRGIFPEQPDELRKIKGLGPYTIGAIRSFAFHHKTAAVDGNVIRVLARYFKIEEDITKPKTIKKVWELAESILPDEEPWVINEALIELGATLCGKQPRCQECPLKKQCQAYQHGMQQQLPIKSKKVATSVLYRAVAIIQWKGCVLVRRAPKGEIMSDLYEFPYFELTDSNIIQTEFEQRIKERFQLNVTHENSLKNVSHSFTRYRVHLLPQQFFCKKTKQLTEPHFNWHPISELSQLPFSSGHRRVLQSLLIGLKEL